MGRVFSKYKGKRESGLLGPAKKAAWLSRRVINGRALGAEARNVMQDWIT